MRTTICETVAAKARLEFGQSVAKALTPTDVEGLANVDEATVWGVDPGQRDFFAASDGNATCTHRIRRIFTKKSTRKFYNRWSIGFNIII